MTTKKPQSIIGILEAIQSRRDVNGNTYHAMRYTDCATGLVVCAVDCGGESNIHAVSYELSPDGAGIHYILTEVGKKQYSRMTKDWKFVSCDEKALAAYIRAEIAQAKPPQPPQPPPEHSRGAIRAAQVITGGAYSNGKTLYKTAYGRKTVKGISEIIDELTNAADLIKALRGLFDTCSMVHSQWGEGCNRRAADAAIAFARETLARATE